MHTLAFLASFKVKLIVLWDCKPLLVAQEKGRGGVNNAASKTHVHVRWSLCFIPSKMHSLGAGIRHSECRFSSGGSHKELVGFGFAAALAE